MAHFWINQTIIVAKMSKIPFKNTEFFGRIALAIPVYRLAMSVCLSVCPSTFWLKFQVEAKSQHWKGLQTWNFVWSFYWFLWLLWPWPWFVDFQGQIADNPALPSFCFLNISVKYMIHIFNDLGKAKIYWNRKDLVSYMILHYEKILHLPKWFTNASLKRLYLGKG